MNVAEILNQYREKMDLLDCELLLAHVLRVSREKIYAHPELKLNSLQKKRFLVLLKRRMSGEPLAYLINKKEFFGLDFQVDKRVLIPRPETEILVEEVLKEARKFDCPRILEAGVGSGCIAVVLAKNLKKVKITGIDISRDALTVAKKNIKKHRVEGKIKLKKSDLLKAVKDEKFDLIAANLPYVGIKEKVGFELQYEPKEALFAGEDGLFFYRKFLEQISNLEFKPKFVLLEFGFYQVVKLRQLVRKCFPKSRFYVIKDLSFRPRVCKIEVD